MRTNSLLLCLLVFVAVMSACGAAAMSEAEFRAMKIKDIRKFLDQRSLTCVGCQEKGDFVRMAFANRDKPVQAGKQAREVPTAPFWDAWSELAKHECAEAVSKRGKDASAEPYSHVCSSVAMATESFMMQHGKRVASKLKKTSKHLLETSYKDIYYDAGLVILQKLATYCLSSPGLQTKCQSLGYVTNIMESNEVADYKAWVTNVGIENTNPMYEVLGESADL